MSFNSLHFVIFFAVALALHHAPLPWGVRKLNLIALSYWFYASGQGWFALLLAFSTVIDYVVARRMAATESPGSRRAWLLVSVAGNLGSLSFFKYGGFLLANVGALVHALGWKWQVPEWNVGLPAGISFFTFQTLSYTVDVYRRQIRPAASLLDFACFVSFFPQLVSGPIVRAAQFLPQVETPRRATAAQMSWGLTLLVIGLTQKVVFADRLLGKVVDSAFDLAQGASTTTAWCGALAFSSQIFCDFAGYSLAAIGVALCFGFALPDNFRAPYAAVGFSDFWRRWHISLSSWLRDYLYIPLGGNHGSAVRTRMNLMLTMLIGGLWHGAAWTFVAWGGLHGAFLIIERFVVARIHTPSTRTRRAVGGMVTFAGVVVAWVFFRARSFADAARLLMAMAGAGGSGRGLESGDVARALGVTAALVGVHVWLRNTSLEELAARTPWWARGVVIAACLVALAEMSEVDRAFIYFQF